MGLSLQMGKQGMADDEYFMEWSVPGHLLSLPVCEVAEVYVGAWRQFFALLDEQQAKL